MTIDELAWLLGRRGERRDYKRRTGLYTRAEFATSELNRPRSGPRLRALRASQLGLRCESAPQSVWMAQSRTDIRFGDLGSGFQIGINSGPIHLPPGTSLQAKPDYTNAISHQSDQRHHQVRHLPSHSSAIPTTSIDRRC